jgi:diguanylate cyclase (GGDEF)-like protein
MRQLEIDDVLERLGNPNHASPLIPYASAKDIERRRTIDLRDDPADVEDAPRERATIDVSDAALRRAVKILLIEDSLGDARLVLEMLKQEWGSRFELIHVTRSMEARSQLEAHPDIACALLDLSLPDAQGLSALIDLRQAAPGLPIVVLTGSDRLELAVESLQRGAQDYLVKGRVSADLLSRSLRYAIERQRLETELAHQALHDPLTGLPNRRLFLDRIASALTRLKRRPGFIAVMFVDLDRLKAVNDALGHDAGDRILTETAHRLSEVVRPSDTVARFGGDEFTVLCEGVTDEAEAEIIAGRLVETLKQVISSDGRNLDVTASVGVVVTEGINTTPDALTKSADAAMYEAKALGRARSVLFDAGLGRRASERAALEIDLERALERDQFELFYQPQVALDSAHVVGVEGLLRWGHPLRGRVEPGDFVEIAEDSGAIVPLGAWTLGEATRQAALWREQGLAGDACVSVNISPRQLADPDLPDLVRRSLEESAIDPEMLCLEITETAVITDLEAAARMLGDLKSLGVKLAIDDFGTGYASLTYARRLPIDILKIDRSFVRGVARDPEDAAIVSAVINLAHSLDLEAVAEGVESPDQVTKLRELDCDIAQGHLYAPAVPPAKLTGFFIVEDRADEWAKSYLDDVPA